MQTDLRKTDRIDLSTQPKGELFLLVKGERYSVGSVLNISPQGIRVQINNAVSNAKDVVIQYRHDDINLNVNGTIAWNMPSNERPSDQNGDHSCDIGINLLGPHLLFTLMLT